MRFIAIEKRSDFYADLKTNIDQHDFATARHGSFTEHLAETIELANAHNVFVYVDPWTVEGLDWGATDRLFRLVSEELSVEVLLNLNAASFVRRGLAALKIEASYEGAIMDEEDADDVAQSVPPSMERLNQIMGGAWWQEILKCGERYSVLVERVADSYVKRLSERFRETCVHPVKAEPHHTVPKYYLVFGSRHPHALRLMNDEMVKSRLELAERAQPVDPTLFELRSEELIPDTSDLPDQILNEAERRRPRGDLIVAIVRKNFCKYADKEIRGTIEKLLREKRLASETGSVRINDNVRVWRTKME